ncbi:hypothetical protein NM208_g9585 [Fusarium decemcellulare]|uniref:Uncharacterized protein n=1 Tax=Fusarium decemcellulare TaxID=57161 RepID=A0ACC1S196_9HYPO|nr:hypothetical protein NM208_g9585 [Fusarium decemcellulare]
MSSEAPSSAPSEAPTTAPVVDEALSNTSLGKLTDSKCRPLKLSKSEKGGCEQSRLGQGWENELEALAGEVKEAMKEMEPVWGQLHTEYGDLWKEEREWNFT